MNCLGDGFHSAQTTANSAVRRLTEGLLLASRLLALLVLAIYLPILVVVGLLVLATSPGPLFVKKAYRRRGEKGAVVYLYEFRTECWQTWRETPVGTFLRLADLHRLPRLANVLRGDIAAGERVLPVKV